MKHETITLRVRLLTIRYGLPMFLSFAFLFSFSPSTLLAQCTPSFSGITDGTIYCNDGSNGMVTISINDVGASSGTFYVNGNPLPIGSSGAFSNTDASNTTLNTAALTPGSYTLQYVIDQFASSPCIGGATPTAGQETATISFYVDGAPGTPTFSNNDLTVRHICVGGTYTVMGLFSNTTFSPPATLNYTITSGTVSASSQLDNNFSFTAGGAVGDNIVISVSETNACGTGSTTDFTVEVVNEPTIAPIADRTVCSGESFSIDVAPSIGDPDDYQFVYTTTMPTDVSGPGNGMVNTEITGTLTNASTTTQTVVYTITPQLIGAGVNCTGTPINVNVMVEPEIEASIAAGTNLMGDATAGYEIAVCGSSGVASALDIQLSNSNPDVEFVIVSTSIGDNIIDGNTNTNYSVVNGTVISNGLLNDILVNPRTENGAISSEDQVIYTIQPRINGTNCTGDLFFITVTIMPDPRVFITVNSSDDTGVGSGGFDQNRRICSGSSIDLPVLTLENNISIDWSFDNAAFDPDQTFAFGASVGTSALPTGSLNYPFSDGSGFSAANMFFYLNPNSSTDAIVPLLITPSITRGGTTCVAEGILGDGIPSDKTLGLDIEVFPVPEYELDNAVNPSIGNASDTGDPIVLCSGEMASVLANQINTVIDESFGALQYMYTIDGQSNLVISSANGGPAISGIVGEGYTSNFLNLSSTGTATDLIAEIEASFVNQSTQAITTTIHVTPIHQVNTVRNGNTVTLSDAPNRRCMGEVVSIPVTIEPIPQAASSINNATFATCHGEANTITMEVGSMTSVYNDLEYELRSISIPSSVTISQNGTDDLINTVGQTITAGDDLSAIYENTTNTTQTVIYQFLPKTSNTACQGTLFNLNVTVYPNTTMSITGGNINNGTSLFCSNNTSPIILSNNLDNPNLVGYYISGITTPSTNLANVYNLNDYVGMGNSLALMTPSLIDATRFGEVAYEITAFYDVNNNDTYEAGIDCIGNTEIVNYTIEPTPSFDIYENGTTNSVNEINVCIEDIDVGLNGADISFDLASLIIPSNTSSVAIELVNTSITSSNLANVALVSDTPNNTIFTGANGSTLMADFMTDIQITNPEQITDIVNLTYEFEAKIQNSSSDICSSANQTVHIRLHPSPQVKITTTDGNTTICADEQLTLMPNFSLGTPGTFDYNWTVASSDAGLTINIDNATQQIVNITGTIANTITAGSTLNAMIQLMVTDDNNCTGTTMEQISFIVPPDTNPIMPMADACVGDTVSYQIATKVGHTYQWTLSSGGAIIADPMGSSVDIEWSAYDGLTHILTVVETETATGCSTSNTLNISTLENFVPIFDNCPNTDIIIDAPADACTGIATWPAITVTDACGITEITSNYTSGTAFPLGTTQVTYEVTDLGGLSAACSFNVTVRDVTPPVWSTNPVDLTIDCAANADAGQILNDWLTAIGQGVVADVCDSELEITHNLVLEGSVCNNIGDHLVTFTATDDSNNSSTATATVRIVNNMTPVAFIGDKNTIADIIGENAAVLSSISDPCVCRNNLTTPVQNGVINNNGLFNDEIIIATTTANDTWLITDTDGGRPLPYEYNSDLNAQIEDLTQIELAEQFTYVGFEDVGNIRYYIYTLPIIHQDEIGYGVQVLGRNAATNFTYAPLAVNSACYYPQPFLSGSLGIYSRQCKDPIEVSANLQVADNVFNSQQLITLDAIDSYQMTVTGPTGFTPITISSPDEPRITINPTDFIVGNYTVTFSIDAGTATSNNTHDPGCEITIIDNFEIINPPINLFCNDNVQVSLNENCIAEITPDAILEGDQENYDFFTVEVMNEIGQPIGNTVTSEYIGQTLMVAIIDNCSGNRCMGTISIEDKFAPIFIAPTSPIQVFCNVDTDTIAPPQVMENCGGEVTPFLVSQTLENFTDCDNTSNVIQRIVKTWQAVDEYGNYSKACEQVIEVLKYDLVDVVFPEHYDGLANPTLDCNNPQTSADSLGYPTINGIPVTTSNACRWVLSTSDDILNDCAGSYRIFRTWSIFDWCAPIVNGVNPREHVQIIRVEDNTAPIATFSVTELTVSVNDDNDCEANNIELPLPTVSDDCSSSNNISITINTPRGQVSEDNPVISGLGIGSYEITYQIQDDCGNTTPLVLPLNVVDLQAPTPICDSRTTITINASGTADIDVSNLDGGSYDNCTSIDILGRRMGESPDMFRENITFSCDDVGDTVMVILQITDAFNNSNICMVEVLPDFKGAPPIICPADVSITCDQDKDDLTITGNYSVAIGTGCANLEVTYTDDESALNECGFGIITRTFTVNNDPENTCTQQITIIDNDPLQESDITWPEDIGFRNICNPNTAPDNLPDINARPIINNQSQCSIDPVINFENDTIGDQTLSCFEINRTWTVRGWCDNSVYTYTQVIRVEDTQAPSIQCENTATFFLPSDDCMRDLSLVAPTITDCNLATVITTISGDLEPYADNTSTGFSFIAVPEGSYSIMWTATDECGNASSCMQTINVVDNTGPTGLCMPLTLTLTEAMNVMTIMASEFVPGLTDNCDDVSDLVVAFSQDATDLSRTYGCEDRSINNQPVTLPIWTLDTEGNWTNLCDAKLTINSMTAATCGDGVGGTMTGSAITTDELPIEGVKVKLTNSWYAPATTRTDGGFTFEDVLIGADYTVLPEKNDELTNGVTTFDLYLMAKHILNSEPLTDPYQLIAADINASGTITTLDMVLLRKVILNIDDEFPNNTSWRFVPSDYEFIDPAYPFDEPFPTFINVNNFEDNTNEINFIGIKIGDVNGSIIPNNSQTISERQAFDGIPLFIENNTLKEGETHTIYIQNTSDISWYGFQFSLGVNTDDLSVESVQTRYQLNNDHISLDKKSLQTEWIDVSWHDTALQYAQPNEPLLQVVLRAKKTTSLDKSIFLDTKRMPAEWYDKNEQLGMLELNFKKANAGSTILYPNRPNPFSKATIIGFELDKSEEATLSVFDMTGQLVTQHKATYKKGYQEWSIPAYLLPQSGLYYYQLSTSSVILTKKMIFIR